MTRLFCLLLILLFINTEVNCQQITVHGYLQDSITHFPIADGIITNVNSKKKASSDSKGYFRIEAAPNDFFYVLANSYRYDTITYSLLFSDTITIYLSPSGNILPTVTVKTQYNKYQLDSMRRRGEFEESRGNQLTALSSPNSSGFGIALNLDRIFKKKYKHKKRSESVFVTVEKSRYINYRFSPHLVAYYTGFKGDTLRSFIQRFTPGYAWLRQHPSGEDIVYYINDKLKEFQSSKNH
jgi:hypothetical protein